MKKRNTIISMLLVFTLLFSFLPLQVSAAPDISGIEDAFKLASEYFKADAYVDQNGFMVGLAMKEDVIKKLVTLVPQIEVKRSGTGWRQNVYVNKLRVHSISGETIVLNADIRVKYYRVALGKKIKLADKNGTCKIKMTLNASKNDVVVDSSKIYDINLDFNLFDYLTGAVFGTIIVDKIIQGIKINDSNDKVLIPLSELISTKDAELVGIENKDGFMWFIFDVTSTTQKAVAKLKQLGIPVQ